METHRVLRFPFPVRGIRCGNDPLRWRLRRPIIILNIARPSVSFSIILAFRSGRKGNLRQFQYLTTVKEWGREGSEWAYTRSMRIRWRKGDDESRWEHLVDNRTYRFAIERKKGRVDEFASRPLLRFLPQRRKNGYRGSVGGGFYVNGGSSTIAELIECLRRTCERRKARGSSLRELSRLDSIAFD